jgi:hypothetical protein
MLAIGFNLVKNFVTTNPLHANTTGRIAPKYHCKDCIPFGIGVFSFPHSLNKAKKKKNLFLAL